MCSGLDVDRYSPDSLQEELGPEYVWLESGRFGYNRAVQVCEY